MGVYAALGKYMHENRANDAFDGTSTGAFNYAVEPMIDHIEAWRNGDVAGATNVWNSGLAHLHEYIFADVGRLHIRYKIATWLGGFIDNPADAGADAEAADRGDRDHHTRPRSGHRREHRC